MKRWYWALCILHSCFWWCVQVSSCADDMQLSVQANREITVLYTIISQAAAAYTFHHAETITRNAREFVTLVTPEIMYHLLMQRSPIFDQCTVLEKANIISLDNGPLLLRLRKIFVERICNLGVRDYFLNNLPEGLYSKKYFNYKSICENNVFVGNRKSALSFILLQSFWGQQHETIKVFFNLVNKNNDPVLSPVEKQRALAIAADHGDESLCDFILLPQYGVNVNDRLPNDPVHPTALSRVKECALAQKFITHYGATVAHDTRLLFNAVLRTNNVDLVRFYAQKGASLENCNGETIFHTLALADCAGEKPLSAMAQAIWDARPNDCLELITKNFYGYCGSAVEWAQKIAQHLPKDHPRAVYRDFLEKRILLHRSYNGDR